MDLLRLRYYARRMMGAGSAAILIGAAIMAHGELNFGDGVMIIGVVLLIVGVALLARTPTGDAVPDPVPDHSDNADGSSGS